MVCRHGGALALVAALAMAAAGCSQTEPTPDPGDDIDRTTESPDSAGLRSRLADLYAGTGPTHAGAAAANCFAGALLDRTDAAPPRLTEAS